METVSATLPDDSSGANPSSVKSDDSSPRHESGRGSPPPNCAICLGTCRNKSFTDSCLHQFCFKCLLTWSKVKAECPLCKQNFRSIIHNVRSNHQYEEYMVEQRQAEETTERIDIDNNFTTTRRFRYSTTFTLPRRETFAIQQLLVHYPIMDVFPARAPPARRRRSPAAFRRTVYRHNLWARPLPDFTGRYRDCTPEFYRYNDTQMHRLAPWISRELHYLLNENTGHISYVMTRILELLPQYHIRSSEFSESVHRYFGDRTEHFLHELYCFASTPYDMTGYDRNVQYTTDSRISTMVNEVISSSDTEASIDSDIVMVSSSEPAEQPPGPSRLPAPVYPQNYIPHPPVDNVIPIETISHSDTDDDSSEVMVVGYIKPPQERTPEIVDLLGSDSDVIIQENSQPEPTQGTSREDGVVENSASVAPLKLVKLSLKRHSRDSDSEGSLYAPPPRRRRRARSPGSATTSDTDRATPDWASPSPAPSPSSDTPSDLSTSSSDRRRRVHKKKSRRKNHRDTDSADKNKRKHKKRSGSHSHHRDRSPSTADAERDRRSKRKSNSGKGVKSSKRSSEAATAVSVAPVAPVAPVAEVDQPGPSGSSSRHKSDRDRSRRRNSRESKRLRSVVNIMYSHKNSGDSSPSGSSNLGNNSNTFLNHNSSSGSIPGDDDRDRKLNDVPIGCIEDLSFNTEMLQVKSCANDDDSDSEDNLPLNLTMQKSYTNGSAV